MELKELKGSFVTEKAQNGTKRKWKKRAKPNECVGSRWPRSFLFAFCVEIKTTYGLWSSWSSEACGIALNLFAIRRKKNE